MPLIIDQFGRKRCQKKRKDVDYNLLLEFFQKYFVVHEQLAAKNSFSTFVCYAPDGLFWLNLYKTLLCQFYAFEQGGLDIESLGKDANVYIFVAQGKWLQRCIKKRYVEKQLDLFFITNSVYMRVQEVG